MTVNKDVLKEAIFADTPRNWYVHSVGFYHAGWQLAWLINKDELPKIMTQEWSFHHRYSNKIAVYLLSHALELLLKASVSDYKFHNPLNNLKEPVKYGHNAKLMFKDLVSVNYLEKNEDDEEIIELVDAYLKWYGRYFSPNRSIDKTIKEDYIEDENGFVEFKHNLSGAHEKLISFYKRIRLQIKLGYPLFHYSFQSP